MSARTGLRMLLMLVLVVGVVTSGAPAAMAQPPPNDDLDNATVIPSLPFADELDTSLATTAADDPECAGNGHTVWYSFTPEADTIVGADTFGSDYDTTLSAYTGERGALEQVACNDDTFGLQSRISFLATGGITYFIMVGSFFDSPGGQLVLSVQEVQPAPNDNFDDATVIESLPFEETVNTVAATSEADDPNCFGNAHSIWYEFTPTDDMLLQADVFGFDFQPSVSVYTGVRGALDQIGCSTFRVRWEAAAGTTYFMMVASASFDGDEPRGGDVSFRLREIPPPLEVGVTIDPTGTVDRAGVATIHGSVTCSREAVGGEILGTLRQQIGRRVTVGSFDASVDCSGEARWDALVVGETGTYRRGDAQATVVARFFDPEREELVQARTSRTIRLQS